MISTPDRLRHPSYVPDVNSAETGRSETGEKIRAAGANFELDSLLLMTPSRYAMP
jgi:hypothetical protein